MKTKQLEASKNALLNALTGMAMFSLAAVFPELAFAQAGQGLNQLTGQINDNASSILPVISTGAYIGGTIFGVSTLLDAKKYSENPSGFQGGVGKIATKGGVAAGLFSLPSVMGIVQDSMFKGNDAEYKKLNEQFN